MMGGLSRRGHPLIALVLLIGGWVSARAMMWEAPRHTEVRAVAGLTLPVFAGWQADEPETRDATETVVVASAALPARVSPSYRNTGRSTVSAAPPILTPLYRLAEVSAPPSLSRVTMPIREPELPPAPPAPVQVAVGHQLLWMAALAHIPIPPSMAGFPLTRNVVPVPFYPAAQAPLMRPRRWSADSWIMWRRGGNSALAGGLLTPSYGASQAGVVLRYRFAPDSGHRPAAYLRATAALNGTNEREAALGLSARPFAKVPIVLAGEARFTSAPGGQHIRPAAYAVTELPPLSLPLGLRGEAYGQAGYVGGKFATGFADGQLRVDHRLVRLGAGEVRFGGGVWGGIQKGASRVDAGPSLTIGQPLGGPAALRLAADWRFRIGGKAAPGSGPAITLSAGF